METQQYDKTLGEALSEIPNEEAKPVDDGFIHLSTGVILAPKKVSPFIFQQVTKRFKDPEVPKFYNDNKGREEENPAHPDYIKAVEENNYDRSMAMIDAVIALGTKLISIPEDMCKPEEDDWLDDLESTSIFIDRDNARLRYRTWVKYFAAPAVDDVQLIVDKVLKAVGVSAEEVARATASFQR